VLLDQEGITVDVRQLDPAKSIEAGTIVEFPFYHVVVGEIWASPIAPTRLGRSALRPRRALGPSALFPLDPVSPCVDSRPGQDGFDRAADNLPPMAATCAPLTCSDPSSGVTTSNLKTNSKCPLCIPPQSQDHVAIYIT
jgi:hypothetical protein